MPAIPVFIKIKWVLLIFAIRNSAYPFQADHLTFAGRCSKFVKAFCKIKLLSFNKIEGGS